ncbi:cytochrome b/b6 domain-containing protein [Paracoccus laeviglucosivorans]|uniref:Cytochrome b561 n=1 Tax=Paracoccus laeviglucosivorans TaxID=1197861 RepID=A0A521D530_9RHOB|nr:cytochrome b/b6 domain-containing protein [Paracoccus laeviglucosivorans]SMO66813.1 Cytochrome b561 [Paracoccus laeviglucosivorans]
MKASNDARAYGGVARLFHWSIALLILAAIGLGLYAGNLPRGTQDQLQAIFAAFSVHKTVGVAVLILAVLRILWTLTQTKPKPLHPQRRAETFVAEMVHWAMWIGMVIMPLTGWLLHSAAPGGFSRILWPLGQRLPMVPEDAHLAERFAAFHETGWWVLAGLIVLHVAGAIKHTVIDRDGTLNRMAGPAHRAPEPPHSEHPLLMHLLAAVGALLIWAATAVLATPEPEAAEAPVTEQPATAPVAAQASGWAVQQGTLGIEVIQGGNPIQGQFGTWNAQIDYDPETQAGRINVGIDIASLSLGSVSDSAKGPDFLNAAAHPQANFAADILPPADGGQHIAKGKLTIAGKTVDAELPFDLTVDGANATASGMMKVDRRDFGIGTGYADESTVGFTVAIKFDLTATQQ